MSNGAFRLVVNSSGLQDNLLVAPAYLTNRLAAIAAINTGANKNASDPLDISNSWMPTVNMINKSHVMFVNGAFKPFVSCAFEYVKSSPTGDINFGSTLVFDLTSHRATFLNDCVLRVKLGEARTVNQLDRIRYAAFLGHRLIRKATFKVSNNILDTYDSDAYNAFYEFHVPEHKKIGWMRNVGQEVPQMGLLTADPAVDVHSEYKWFGDGNQTYKQKHGEIELWIPMLFWFREIHNAFPFGNITHGECTITIELADINKIIGFAPGDKSSTEYIKPSITCEMYVNNIWIDANVAKLFNSTSNKFGFSLIRVHQKHTGSHDSTSGKSPVKLQQLKWPTETLYIAFRPTANASLSQHWYKNSFLTARDIKTPVVARDNDLVITTVGTSKATKDSIEMNTAVLPPSLFPITSITDYTGYDLVITGGGGYDRENVLNNRYIVATLTGTAPAAVKIEGVWRRGKPDATTTFDLYTPQLAINTARYYSESPVVKTIQLQSENYDMFGTAPETFYNSYLPYRFGDRMNTPADRGWYMTNFNFHPGDHQPSGYINLSASRQFNLIYTLAADMEAVPFTLIVLATAINFLLVKGDTAVLRYGV